jgi:hypothetical protein
VVTSFGSLADDVTQTCFETFVVTANWDEANPYDMGRHTLSPSGALVEKTDGRLTAGVFQGYNGVPLTPGDHYLVESRGLADIIVRQPIGPDTSLTLDLPPTWAPSDPIEVRACSASQQVIGTVPATVTASSITFVYNQEREGQEVAYYQVSNARIQVHEAYLPVVLRAYP